MKKIMGMCEGRHVIPQVTEYLFGTVINPLDLEGLESTAAEKLQNVDSLDLYVTGLTVATVCVINVCANLGIALTLYHYDRETGNYYQQKVRIPAPCIHKGYYQCG